MEQNNNSGQKVQVIFYSLDSFWLALNALVQKPPGSFLGANVCIKIILFQFLWFKISFGTVLTKEQEVNGSFLEVLHYNNSTFSWNSISSTLYSPYSVFSWVFQRRKETGKYLNKVDSFQKRKWTIALAQCTIEYIPGKPRIWNN